MVFFKQLSTSLKQKWLEYYQKNRPWLILHMTEQNTVQTPDGGRRPVSYLILGILNALEPELEALMLPFSKLKADADSLVEVLELNFDPDIAIGQKPGSSVDDSTPMDKRGEDAQELPGADQPLMPDTIEDSNDLGTSAAAAITGAAAIAGGVALAAGLDQDSDDLSGDDQSESDLELESDDDLDIGLDSESEADDDLDLDIESAADELDMQVDSDLEVDDGLDLDMESADDDLDIGLDSESEADDDLDIGLDSESESDDDLDMGLDSESEADDDLDMGLDSESEADDDLDIGLDSDSEADDDLDMGLDSESEADDDLDNIDLGDLDGNGSDVLEQGEDSSDFLAEDIPDPFEDTSAKLDESGLDELGDDDVDLFGKDSSDEIGDIDLDLGDDLSSDDLGDLDLDLDGDDLNLDEADLDSLAGDKKSSNDDLEGLLG